MNALIELWKQQMDVEMRGLPTATLSQRAVYWRVSRKKTRKIQGRARRVALRLVELEETARCRRWREDEGCASDETYAIRA